METKLQIIFHKDKFAISFIILIKRRKEFIFLDRVREMPLFSHSSYVFCRSCFLPSMNATDNVNIAIPIDKNVVANVSHEELNE